LTCFAIRSTARALLAVGVLAALGLAGCGGGSTSRGRSAGSLTNPFLGPESTSWLVGPIARLATPAEIESYLAVQDDAQAEAFIERFWDSRDPTPDRQGNPVRETFEERAAQADRLYSEAGYLGRRTDRGTIYVLYGSPQKVDFEVSSDLGSPNLEVWTYGPGAPSGLDARKPAALYRFVRRGDLTVFYVPGSVDPRLRQPPLNPYGA
jgi:GWxTD domain-containing protein